MSNEFKEYIVTTSDVYDSYLIHEELVTSDSESSSVPERSVEVASDMLENPVSTGYFLTDEEASTLLEDERVVEVINPEEIAVRKFAFQTGSFDKTTNASGDVQNWGLLRHINDTNIFGTSTLDPGGSYDYVLDGTGVDVVIIDSGIQADHPEFQDADGVSRVKQIDWYQAAGVVGTMPAGFYTDYDGHGTHVAATVAGKTFGWAKNADVYAMKLAGLEGGPDPNSGISINTALQLILLWHQAKTNGRPTVINNSWGIIWYWQTSNNTVSVDGVNYSTVASLTYRGSTITSGITRDTSRGLIGQQISATEYVFGRRISFIDSWISSMISAGILVCNAAGNDRMKIDVSGGLDYDNNIVLDTGGTVVNYHRGSSPNTDGLDGFEVGSIGLNFVSSSESKSSYSSTGPGVDIYAAGDRIISAMSQINDDNSTTPYYLNTSFKQQRLSGTSMASPQVAGVCALILHAHPDWTPRQVVKWVDSYSQNIIYSTGLNNDYNTSSSILGGSGKVLYLPMNGQLVFDFSDAPSTSPLVEYFFVGGGASGGCGRAAGGGGAGFAVDGSFRAIPYVSYPVTIGAGGAGVLNSFSNGNFGGYTNFGYLGPENYIGGGGGRGGAASSSGGTNTSSLAGAATTGGAAVGAATITISAPTPFLSGIGGFKGGNATGSLAFGAGAGGGGMGGEGFSAGANGVGQGGIGVVGLDGDLYAAGGAGMGWGANLAAAQSDYGGGGDGSPNAAQNSGSGGAGGHFNSSLTSGNGGSGVVVLKVPDTHEIQTTLGVVFTTTTEPGFSIYKITAAGASDKITFVPTTP